MPDVHAMCATIESAKEEMLRRYELVQETLTGIGDACRQAGIDVPQERIKATTKARRTRKKKPSVSRVASQEHLGIVLTESQIARLQGIAHLERGKNIGLVIDEILDRDTYLRREKGLSLDDTKAVFTYIDRAKKNKWPVNWLLRIHVKLWNSGVMSLSSQAVEELASFLKKMKAKGWEAGDTLGFLNYPFVKDTLPGLSPEEGEKLAFLLREVDLKDLTVSEYLKQIDEVRHAISWHQAYVDGRVTYEQFKKKVNLQ